LKNVRDDAMDCLILGVGYTPAVAPTADGNKAVGFLPPSIGAYVELTEFLHFGALFKGSADLEIDRRAAGAVVDVRTKFGLGPLHHIKVKQHVIMGNAYKTEENQMDGWREHMRGLRDPIFRRPAKELIFDKSRPLRFLHRGWQDWEVISLEVAIPEPFILHSGFNFRVGIDPSQIFDFVMGLVCIDIYDDNAYRFSGKLQHAEDGDKR
jgi:hypothetical protein